MNNLFKSKSDIDKEIAFKIIIGLMFLLGLVYCIGYFIGHFS